MRLAAWLLVLSLVLSGSIRALAQSFVVLPQHVTLAGNFERAQLVVISAAASGQINERCNDLTTQATYRSSNPAVVTVASSGQLLAVSDGDAKITVTVNDATREVPVTVSGVAAEPQVAFTQSIRPILNKAGCAMAA